MNELVLKMMNYLGCTEAEALELIEEDKRIDKMTMKELTADLTDEQKKVIKSATQGERKPTTYKFSTRERKANTDKRELIELVRTALEDSGVADVSITNVEREMTFTHNGTKYKITLSAPRS